jgi:hypothetical protein
VSKWLVDKRLTEGLDPFTGPEIEEFIAGHNKGIKAAVLDSLRAQKELHKSVSDVRLEEYLRVHVIDLFCIF